ncbi:restriction endonuclease subunit S [Gimesia aquarii]|uniref:Type I restriction modification DNA specificity domain protein n=1 Tax=Gimesia aquarii TaxID=2527964 RepID=A0A517WWR9_9PLAN|nr:restriction endonuclease subunit S [Gimesia aquarii]QDU09642.1 hypothetical protein V202x_30180 [Gimesia aquarii]
MIDGLKPYSDYKDSALPWLGKIPAHWTEKRAKYFYREVDERSTTGTEELLSVSHKTGVTPRPKHVTMFKAESNIGHKICRSEDLVINTMWAFMAALGVSRQVGVVSPSYGVYRPIRMGELHPQYIDRLLRIEAYKSEYLCRSTGIRASRLRLYPDEFLRIPILSPPPEEQSAIVRFLDHADRRIRRYIRAKRKLIELLNEQKQALIHQAVTRGLDPHIKLKPSGVKWIGDVPEHWEVQRCRYIFREVDKRSLDGSELHLSMSQKLGLVPSHQVDNRTLVSENYAGGKLCEVNDLVLNRLKAHLGVFSLARNDGVISPDYTVLRAIDICGVEYFEHLLKSPACRYELRVRAKGIVEGFWRLYTDDFYDIRLPVPPAEERNQIVARLAEIVADCEVVCTRADRECDLLREYRTRLIADVVTGKLDVREAAAQLDGQVVEEPSKRRSAKQPNKHFYRSVLAAEIVDRHQGERRFGRIKLQKALVLAEYHLQLTEIQSDLKRAAAGPFDNAMMRSIDAQLKKQKWFEAYKSEDAGYQYKPLKKRGSHQTYFDRYWSSKQADFDRLISLLKPMRTIQAEIVATLYSAWNDFLIDGEQFDDDRLVAEVLTNWHPKKERITRNRWHKAIQWMRDYELVPTGFGAHTQQATKKVKK